MEYDIKQKTTWCSNTSGNLVCNTPNSTYRTIYQLNELNIGGWEFITNDNDELTVRNRYASDGGGSVQMDRVKVDSSFTINEELLGSNYYNPYGTIIIGGAIHANNLHTPSIYIRDRDGNYFKVADASILRSDIIKIRNFVQL